MPGPLVGRTERTLPREFADWFPRAAMPTLRVPDFTMSTVSPGSDRTGPGQGR